MTEPRFQNSDLEEFAEYLGLNGIDTDLYYESYYQMNNDDEYDDYDLEWGTQTESIELCYD